MYFNQSVSVNFTFLQVIQKYLKENDACENSFREILQLKDICSLHNASEQFFSADSDNTQWNHSLNLWDPTGYNTSSLVECNNI